MALVMSCPFGLLFIDTQGSLKVDNGRVEVTYATAIRNNTWTCVDVLMDQNDLRQLRVFVNGEFVSGSGVVTAVADTVYGLRTEQNVIWAPYFTSSYQLDNLRVYYRALSDYEVKALYDYESIPQPANPRVATATAQVVNGFVIGATVTDGGSGYTNTPSVTITGGGGSGAKAKATMLNGVVTAITILSPGTGYTFTPTITVASPPFPPRRATGTAQVINGFVVGASITDSGFGYTEPPNVFLFGGGGSGATASAIVQNGVVTGITILNPGTGYTSAPTIRIASPPFSPSLSVEVSRVTVTLRVVQGRKYQLESTSDMNTWTPTGAAFVAQDETLVQEFAVSDSGRFFRITQIP